MQRFLFLCVFITCVVLCYGLYGSQPITSRSVATESFVLLFTRPEKSSSESTFSIKGMKVCTGTIVSKDTVITAAHCFSTHRNLYILHGQMTYPGQKFEVHLEKENYYPHKVFPAVYYNRPSYFVSRTLMRNMTDRTHHYDIGVVRTNVSLHQFNDSQVMPICHSSKVKKKGQYVATGVALKDFRSRSYGNRIEGRYYTYSDTNIDRKKCAPKKCNHSIHTNLKVFDILGT